MNNVFDGMFIMKISKKVLEFLNREDVQDALARNDTQELYKLATDASRQGRLLVSDIGELTSILMQAGIDPLLGMTEIPVYFLYEREGIKSFNIPQGITKIGVNAFEHTDLESITIPNSVKVISTGAFRSCAGLKTVELPTGVELYESVFSLSGLESIELKDVKLQDSSIFWSCEQLKSVIIRGDTPVIPNETFAKCYKLTHVELPTSVELHGSVFSHSGLESIELKDVKLRDIIIFYNCKQLKSVTIKGDTPVIPDRTFEGCLNLTHVELPASLKEIERSIFLGCNRLRKIDFAGTMEQWRDIEIDKNNARLFSCKIICSDGILKYDKVMEEWVKV